MITPCRELLDDASHTPISDERFALSDRLPETSWRVGSATYCLSEWAEPSDDTADHEPPDGHNRRDIYRWR